MPRSKGKKNKNWVSIVAFVIFMVLVVIAIYNVFQYAQEETSFIGAFLWGLGAVLSGAFLGVAPKIDRLL